MISADQELERQHHIGSSDPSALFGCHPYGRTEREVYFSKVEPLPPRVETKSFQVGNLLEEPICLYAAHELGVELERNVFVVSQGDDGGIIAANLDAKVKGQRWGIEAKYAGEPDKWGDEGTDQIPEGYIIQCQHQMYAADLDVVWVPALVSGFRLTFRLYCVRRNEDLIKAIVARGVEFWRSHVEPRNPPDGNPVPPLDIVKHRPAVAGKVVDGDDELLTAWRTLEEARAEEREAREAKEFAAARVFHLLGDAQIGKLPSGGEIGWREKRNPASCDSKQLRALHPQIWTDFFTQGSHRELYAKGLK